MLKIKRKVRYFLDSFPDPLPMGSGTGVQCLPKRGIFLFGLAQHKIGFGWESMAHIWNSADLTKPLSTAQPSIHSLSLELELILGSRQFDCHCISVTDFFPAVNPYCKSLFAHCSRLL